MSMSLREAMTTLNLIRGNPHKNVCKLDPGRVNKACNTAIDAMSKLSGKVADNCGASDYLKAAKTLQAQELTVYSQWEITESEKSKKNLDNIFSALVVAVQGLEALAGLMGSDATIADLFEMKEKSTPLVCNVNGVCDECARCGSGVEYGQTVCTKCGQSIRPSDLALKNKLHQLFDSFKNSYLFRSIKLLKANVQDGQVSIMYDSSADSVCLTYYYSNGSEPKAWIGKPDEAIDKLVDIGIDISSLTFKEISTN